MKMPWGKHKGFAIHKLPSNYLYWLATADVEKYPYGNDVATEADKEWQWREKHNQHKGNRKYDQKYR